MASKSPNRLLPKQPLAKPSRHCPQLLNSTCKSAEFQFRLNHAQPTGGADLPTQHQKLRETPVIEFDASRVLQPFLDEEKVLAGLRKLEATK
ncbi:hypothetical protein LOZ61_003871 [Ophidiomyces ophidiicola]|nr:hypothetical protein LOZ61_003871 [Ophidiomyces ophidiicola]KAI1926864.1 hypothetical protein LOZ60_003354 [Ophidiomyces ophidiicola]KAI1958781.1 hypothetical protein LOZ59_003344 [Ophidiomyces ophidiicola]KAI1972131.1 hypothetical protein LOZ56_002657 [Ophidiomyces ophidiicola]KAI2009058.1 hypothetical protein LOZ50_001704 [Ophidiomyces ophidiicola]